MHRLRRILPILILGVAWIAFSYHPTYAQSTSTAPVDVAQTSAAEDADSIAVAQPDSLEEYGVSCEGDACTVNVSLDRFGISPIAKLGASFAIELAQDNLNFLPDNAGIEIEDDLTLKLPIGDLELIDADLALALDEDGHVERLRGTAQVPFPSVGVFENVDLDAPVRADLGLETGANLAHLNAPLDPERQYLFLDFNSGLVAESNHKVEGEDHTVRLSVPRGQNATLIIDPREPYAYLSGNVTVSIDDQLAFVGQMIDLGGAETLIPDGLPIRQRIGMQVTSSIGKGAEPFFQAGGTYSVDAGMIGNLIGVEIRPLATQGLVTLDRSGIILDGIAQSQIAPETLFDGRTSAQIFLPFDTDMRSAYAQIDAEMLVPFAGASAEAMARLDGYQGILAQASMTTPFSDGNDEDAVAIAQGSDVELVKEVDSDGEPRFKLVGTLADGAANIAADTVTRSYLFVKNGAADGAATGLDWTQNAWCGVSGRCATDSMDEAVAVK
jgi:hypothetical protein